MKIELTMEQLLAALTKHGPFALALGAVVFIAVDAGNQRAHDLQARLEEAKAVNVQLVQVVEKNTESNTGLKAALERLRDLIERR
jgi:hypothetical protein